ncbi:MAG: peptide-methionine (S)-S-oxide reductase MsrA [Phycisphaerales bacterium]|nr:peptide-methionine (S)-S-oxide reductase MsrA [Phycisphaerales bacterium]
MSEKHNKLETALFGAGCFWGVEETFRKQPGVRETSVGYSGGAISNPSYELVCSGKTGHAEVVQITFDPSDVSYEELLNVFWDCHDPTQMNRQGPDRGSQYRSVIFYNSTEQAESARDTKRAQSTSNRYRQPIVTEISIAGTFWPAEEYHQQYLAKRGMGACPSQ